MKDIKVGDRVRTTRGVAPYFCEGDVGTVVAVERGDPKLAQVKFHEIPPRHADGVWWEQVKQLELFREAFTVILMRPYDVAGTYGQDTFMTAAWAPDPVEALKLAREEVIESDYGSEPFDGDPCDYFCIAVLRGDHLDLNPE